MDNKSTPAASQPDEMELDESEIDFKSIGIGCLFVLITWMLCMRGSSNGNGKKKASGEKGVIICGESGSGKTVLMYFLAKREMCQTVSSMTTNDAKFKVDKENPDAKMVRFVDIPGHVNFREDVYAELDNAKGIVYLVDSSQKSDVDASGSFLYEMFLRPGFTAKNIPMLIVSNKRDILRTIPKNLLREELIKEVERIKISKKSHTTENTENDYILGNTGRFSFDEVKGGSVTFAECSVKDHEINEVLEFLKSL